MENSPFPNSTSTEKAKISKLLKRFLITLVIVFTLLIAYVAWGWEGLSIFFTSSSTILLTIGFFYCVIIFFKWLINEFTLIQLIVNLIIIFFASCGFLIAFFVLTFFLIHMFDSLFFSYEDNLKAAIPLLAASLSSIILGYIIFVRKPKTIDKQFMTLLIPSNRSKTDDLDLDDD